MFVLMGDQLKPNQREILRAIGRLQAQYGSEKPLRMEQIAKEAGVSCLTVKRHMASLVSTGFLERIASQQIPGRPYIYTVKNDGGSVE